MSQRLELKHFRHLYNLSVCLQDAAYPTNTIRQYSWWKWFAKVKVKVEKVILNRNCQAVLMLKVKVIAEVLPQEHHQRVKVILKAKVIFNWQWKWTSIGNYQTVFKLKVKVLLKAGVYHKNTNKKWKWFLSKSDSRLEIKVHQAVFIFTFVTEINVGS